MRRGTADGWRFASCHAKHPRDNPPRGRWGEAVYEFRLLAPFFKLKGWERLRIRLATEKMIHHTDTNILPMAVKQAARARR